MKVYVDELPKCCGDCVFCKQTEYHYYCDKLHTKLGYFDKDKDCPLVSLADHDKQVRKQVCDDIKHRLDNIEVETNTDYNSFIAILDEILDRIEKGETNENNKETKI